MDDNLKTTIEQYLKIYRPGHALLITGEWGVGKTYQVKRAVSSQNGYYISLFGIPDIQSLKEGLLKQMHPTKSNIERQSKRLRGFKLKSKFVDIDPDKIMLIDYEKDLKQDSLIIIDDLERSKIDITIILGFINYCLEECGCRIIVISNEEKLSIKFREVKEKIFGSTFRIFSTLEEPFRSFCEQGQVYTGVKLSLMERDCILSTYKESQNQSLRLLRQLVYEVCQVLQDFFPDFRQREREMSVFLPLYCCLSIEFKTGKISERHIRHRSNLIRSIADGKNEFDVQAFLSIVKKYPSVYLDKFKMWDSFFYERICNGLNMVSSKGVKSAFLRLDFDLSWDSAPWYTIYDYANHDDWELADAKANIDKLFHEELFDTPTKTLHAFAAKFFLSHCGEIEETISQVNSVCENILDKIEIDEVYLDCVDASFTEDPSDEYNDSEYLVLPQYEAYFLALKERLYAICEHKVVNFDDSRVEVLMEAFLNDPFGFERIYLKSEIERAILNPILVSFPVDYFVNCWLGCSVSIWDNVITVLNNRLFSIRNNDSLLPEADWFRAMDNSLKKKIDDLNGLSRLRLEHYVSLIDFEMLS